MLPANGVVPMAPVPEAMTDMIQSINGKAKAEEILHHIHVALAVGTQIMNQQHKRLWHPLQAANPCNRWASHERP
jgi:hypothetical protein